MRPDLGYVWLQLVFAASCLLCGSYGLLAAVKPSNSGIGRHMPLKDRVLLYRGMGLLLFLFGLLLLFFELPFVL